MCDDKVIEKLKAFLRLAEVPIPAVFDLSQIINEEHELAKKMINKKAIMLAFKIKGREEIEDIKRFFHQIFKLVRTEYNKSLRAEYNRSSQQQFRYDDSKRIRRHDDSKPPLIPPVDVGYLQLAFFHDFNLIKLIEPIGHYDEPFQLTYCHTGKHFFKLLVRKFQDIDVQELCEGHYNRDNTYTDLHDIKDAVQILIDINDGNSSKNL